MRSRHSFIRNLALVAGMFLQRFALGERSGDGFVYPDVVFGFKELFQGPDSPPVAVAAHTALIPAAVSSAVADIPNQILQQVLQTPSPASSSHDTSVGGAKSSASKNESNSKSVADAQHATQSSSVSGEKLRTAEEIDQEQVMAQRIQRVALEPDLHEEINTSNSGVKPQHQYLSVAPAETAVPTLPGGKMGKVASDIRQQPPSGSSMIYHGHKIVRGVNIGGYLVPEFWITPSMVANLPEPKPTDYLQLCKYLGPERTLALMKRHWDTWVSEDEISRLAGSGITHLRIPIGHWEFIETDEGFVGGGLPYFKQLVYWANKYGLKVVPDMHTAPGSQNGFDNSGTTQGINWTRDPNNVRLSKQAMLNMLRYISKDPVLLATVDAVDVLNEPMIDALDFSQLWEYDTGAHSLITNGLNKTPPVISIIDRGFKEFSWWHGRFPRDWNSYYTDTWLDAHLYHVFDRNIDDWPLERHLSLVCSNGRDLQSNATMFPIIVGEWSLALPTAALGGRENEARRRFAEAQLDAYEKGGAGWFFWCFKTESSPEWSFLDSLDRSWLPYPLTTRAFPPVCHY